MDKGRPLPYSSWTLIAALAGGLAGCAGPQLRAAASGGDVGAVQSLIQKGVDVNAADGFGETALFDAAMAGSDSVVKTLISAGANLNAANTNGVEALSIAIDRGHPSVAKALIAAGADLNTMDNKGDTPLILASARGDVESVKALIAAGVNVNLTRPGNGTPLTLAAWHGAAEIVKALLAAGADRNARTGNGYTASDWARQSGRYDLAQLLQPDGAPSAAFPAAGGMDVAAMVKAAQALQAARDGSAAPAAPPRPEPEAAPAAELRSSVDRPRFRRAERPDDYAVVVGVEKYAGDLPEAQFAERDAQAVRANLIALGYPERNIKFLSGVQASKGKLEAYVEEWLPRNVKTDSGVFFYFSGHGAPDPESGRAYLMPFDGDPNFLDKTAYPIKRLYASLGALKARRVVVALDSCFSGRGGRSVLAEGARPLVNMVDADLASGGKILLFAAASSKEITSTLKEEGHGIFTYYFLKGLDGEAKDAAGVITARSLYDYLKPKVQDAASRQNRDQTPVLEGAAAEKVRLE
jgi:hypothetical protein